MWEREIIYTPASATYWASQSKYSDTVMTPAAAGTFSCSKFTSVWTRSTPTGTTEDVGTFSMHMAVVVGSGGRTFLSDSQKSAAESDFMEFLASMNTYVNQGWTSSEFQWHDIVAGDAKYGPMDRVHLHGSAGGGGASTRLPDQLAATVTLKTASRLHWGRFYFPGLTPAAIDLTYGRLTNTYVDALATAAKALQVALNANTAVTEIGVFSKPYQAWLTVDEIQVDNVPDIIRRRRVKKKSYAKVFSS